MEAMAKKFGLSYIVIIYNHHPGTPNDGPSCPGRGSSRSTRRSCLWRSWWLGWKLPPRLASSSSWCAGHRATRCPPTWSPSSNYHQHRQHKHCLLADIHHCSSSKTSKVPTSTNALVELMNMVERWRQRTDYGPVVVVSQDGISRQSSSSSWSCSSSWWWPWLFLGVGFTAPQTPALSRSQLFNWCHLYCYWTLNRSQLLYLYPYHLYNFCYSCVTVGTLFNSIVIYDLLQ